MFTTSVLSKNFTASGAISARQIVKATATDGVVAAAAAATDAILGVAESALDVADTERVDVIVTGIADLVAGGAVAAGDPITSDAAGKAVKAIPAAGVNNRLLGIALRSAANGDIFPVLLSQGSLQG